MSDNNLASLPVEKRADILERRLARAQAALHEAETALEARMRELDRANKDLQLREVDLVARLEIENSKLLSAQRSGGFATVYADRGSPYQSSLQLNHILGLADNVSVTPEIMISCVHPLDRKRILADGKRFFDTLPAGQDHRFEHRILEPSGALRWLRWSLQKDAGPNGVFQSVFGSVHDITESRANQRTVRLLQLKAERRVKELALLTAKLGRSQTQAEQSLNARTEFLSYMAHQFRTPLNTFSGMVDLLSIEGQSDEDANRITFAKRAAERLESLISEVIEEAEGSSPSPTLFPSRTSLTAVLEQTASYWNQAAADSEDAGIVVLKTHNALPDAVSIDAARLREAIDNCTGYGMSAAGDVHITATWRDGLTLSVRTARLAADIDALGAENVLETDPQLRRTIALITAMGGTVSIEPSDQAELSIVIPMAVLEHDVDQQDNRLLNADGEEPSILIAEDTESNRHVIVGLCKRLGCKVQTAVNGAEAVAAAMAEPFDAILMDVQMPIMTGEEAVRHIRSANAENAKTPIIGVTAHSLQAERDRLLAAGMSTCLAKPIQPAELRAALMTAMQATKAGSERGDLFDLRRFREAFEALPEQFHEKFLAAIKEDLINYGSALEKAVDESDPVAADRQAHALKGIAGNIGAVGLTSAIARFREAGEPLDHTQYRTVKEKIAATLEACGDLYHAMISQA